jgi:hypothetical protein
MFNNGPFFFSLFRKYLTYFSYCFSDLNTERYTDGVMTQRIKVPIQYGSKNKQLVRVDTDPNIAKDTSLTVPRMSFVYTDCRYDGARKLASMNQSVNANTTAPNRMNAQFTPVPYNITFKLYVYVNQLEDGTRIVEQILPFFTPDFTASLNLIPEMNEIRDIPIILDSIDIDDQFAGGMLENRAIIYTLTFTMKAYFYAPIMNKPIIKFANTDLWFGTGPTDANLSSIMETVQVVPGMWANGSPDSNNNGTSVSANNIYVSNTYGYIVHANGLLTVANNY